MFFQTQENKMGGIFDYIYDKYPTKYKDIIATGQSSTCLGYGNADVIVRPNAGIDKMDNFATNSVEDSNFTILFPFNKVKLLSYTFQTRTDTNGIHFPLSWIVEAINNDHNWVQIAKVDESGLNSYNQFKTYYVENNGIYRGYKFTMKGNDFSQSKYYFVLHRVEFFGYLYSNKSDHCSQKTCHLSKLKIFMLSIVTAN